MSASPQYDEILNRFERLSTADQLQLLEDLVSLMRRQAMAHPPALSTALWSYEVWARKSGKASMRRNM